MNKRLHIHMIHIAGKHMIVQGTDSLSRGGEFSGSMLSLNVLKFVPLHQSALEHEPDTLEEWITSWLIGPHAPKFLNPDEWYTTGHHYPCCVWTPPPAAADAALEQLLAFSIHKRPQHTHLVIIP
jgi:hypothetical protein